MREATILNFAELLKPITDSSAVGTDLRNNLSDNPYQQAKQLRNQARATERQAAIDGDIGKSAFALWDNVAMLCIKALCEQTKDLEIAVWLIEALARTSSFAGLGDGFLLLKQLLEQFWPDLYPEAEEGNLFTKLTSLAGLNGETTNGTLIAPIYSIPLTAPHTMQYSAWHYLQAVEHAKQTISPQDKKKQNDFTTIEQFTAAVLESGHEFTDQLIKDIEYCIVNYQQLTQSLNQICGSEQSPPSSKITNVLDHCLQIMQKMAKQLFNQQPVNTPSETNDVADMSTKLEPATSNKSTALAEEEALKKLSELADYFQQQNSLSPVPYLLRRAISWSNLSLPDLLATIIPDQAALNYSYELLGILSEQGIDDQ